MLGMHIGKCKDWATMTQDERWMARYHCVMEYLEENQRNPSKHRIEEHDMLNWVKANRKVMNAGKMKAERIEKFEKTFGNDGTV